MIKLEEELQTQVADYLRLKYPKVIFHSDFGSGIHLTKGQAVKQQRQQGGKRAWPDMFIAEPRICRGKQYAGLFIELKREGTKLYKKNGDFASQHLKEQADTILSLRDKGYMADFGIGFDEVKQILDIYLGD